MPSPLHMRHHHHLHKVAHVQAVRRGIKADVEGDRLAPSQQLADFLLVGGLGDHAAGLQFVVHIHVLTIPFRSFGAGRQQKTPSAKPAEGGNTAVPPLFTHSLRNRPHGHLSDQCPCAVTCAHGSLTAPFRRFGSRLRDVFPPAVPPLFTSQRFSARTSREYFFPSLPMRALKHISPEKSSPGFLEIQPAATSGKASPGRPRGRPHSPRRR